MTQERENQTKLLQETAQRLVTYGNPCAAACVFQLAAAACVGYEEILAGKLSRDMRKQLDGTLD